MKPPILVPVVEHGPHGVADDHLQIVVERDVPRVEHAVDVAPQQQPVRHVVLAAIGVRPDTLFLARQTDGRLLFIVVPEESSIERQLLWLFGLSSQLSFEFAPRSITRENAGALDFTTRYILDELGIELEDKNANTIDAIIERFGTKFPSTVVFSDLARSTLIGVDAIDDPDSALLAWLQHEEAMFRRLEHKIVTERLTTGFDDGGEIDVEGFLRFSLGVQNRRKSRMGRALENHLEAIFRANSIQYVCSRMSSAK